MHIVVSGLWHLGCVTAACLAEHYDVVAHDPDGSVVEELRNGRAPVFEPGLDDLIARDIANRRLSFTHDGAAASKADVLWITHDTPVDDHDVSDIDYVARNVDALLPHVPAGALIVISSQIPVGFTRHLEELAASAGADVSFAYVPENLRLGQALDVFRHPERVVAGVRSARDRTRVAELLAPFAEHVIWMTPESSEMTKHALNAFLATSITFINEIAGLCELVGADVKDVERGLKSESRIGPRAYLGAGTGFAGGTLGRDVRSLIGQGRALGSPTKLLEGVLATNELQQHWARRTAARELGEPRGRRIAVLGLTYKAGTDTLRRSGTVEFCRHMHGLGAEIVAYDPVVKHLPPELVEIIALAPDAETAITGADALLIGTEWPEFRDLAPGVVATMRQPVVLDPTGWLESSLGADGSARYFRVGRGRGA